MSGPPRGKLVVISGPSGAGKTTVVRRLFQTSGLPLAASVSATTRPPRPGEVDGRDYHFLTQDDFARRRNSGEFLESFQVYGDGHWYGTLLSEVTPSLERGKWVVLGIDVQGALAVEQRFPEAVTIFLRPSSWEELERRLRGRRTEDEVSVRRRLDRARQELALADRYQHRVINDDVDQAVQQIRDILLQGGGNPDAR